MSTKRIQIIGGFPQSDWAQTDETKTDYIKNKPTLGTLASKDAVSKSDLASDVQASIDTKVSTVNGVAPDADGNVNIVSGGIIDVYDQLPTENINTNSIYRLSTAKFIGGNDPQSIEVLERRGWTCYYVESLPEVGEVCIDTDTGYNTVYYNASDNEVYGYVAGEIGAALSISEG